MKPFIIPPALLLLCLPLFNRCNAPGKNAPVFLAISEGFSNPVGFYDSSPSFSWKLPVSDQIKFQSAYRVVAASDPRLLPANADLWDSEKVESHQSAWVEYRGQPLTSRQKVYWQVKFWDQDGKESAWSEKAFFELGLLDHEDWKALWMRLKPEENPDTTLEGHMMYKPEYFRREFIVNGEVMQARLYITARGVFEARINGQKVGQDVMAPGWTPYQKRIETMTYDIDELVKRGENTLGLVLGEGWYGGRIGYSRELWASKPLPQILCQLEITYRDGKREMIASDVSWKGTRNGPIRFSGIYDGEIYDANQEMPGWDATGFKDEGWEPVEVEEIIEGVRLEPKRHFAVKSKLQLPAVSITEPEKSIVIFDLGQNMVGIPHLQIPVKKGRKVTVRFAEMLQQDGTLYTDNYRSAKSTDYYIPKEDGVIEWQPSFTFHGFRYVELSGFAPGSKPQKEWVTGVAQYSDFEQKGSFSSSHNKLNQLQSNIQWGLRGNFFDIPTDCPQRDERLGWTGDAQVFAPTSLFNCDVNAFWTSWLQSVREEQFENGGIPFVVPNILGSRSSSGWGDAATVIPWELYFRTGDKNILEENYEMMKRWTGYYRSGATDHISEAWSFGDWLQPFPSGGNDNRHGDTPNALISTAYYARAADLTSRAAGVLGLEQDRVEYEALRDSIREAFQKKFFDGDGRLTTQQETQTGYLLALGFDLLQEEIAAKALEHLIAQIEKAERHLRTGFLGTPLLATVLDRRGHSDLMYEILFKETYPSWFYSINQGATTMWERWNSYSHEDGFGDAGMNSFNHYAYGAIGQWMYERIAGIAPLEPGYKRILIAPLPGGPLNHARGEYDCIYGKIVSSWKKQANGFELETSIPPNTTAQIVIPAEEGTELFIDGEAFEDSANVSMVSRADGKIVLESRPGVYRFHLRRV